MGEAAGAETGNLLRDAGTQASRRGSAAGPLPGKGISGLEEEARRRAAPWRDLTDWGPGNILGWDERGTGRGPPAFGGGGQTAGQGVIQGDQNDEIQDHDAVFRNGRACWTRLQRFL